MAMSVIWCFMVAAAVICSAGRAGGPVASASLEGAAAAVNLCLYMAGALCLWSGLMEIMRRAGSPRGFPRLCGRCRTSFPGFRRDETVMRPSANVPRIFGTGNAATPWASGRQRP